MRPRNLGLVQMMVGEAPHVIEIERVHAGTAETITTPVGPILIWHTTRAWRTFRGPDGELVDLVSQLARKGVDLDMSRGHAVFTAGSRIRAVRPLQARGLARWEIRSGLVGRGRLGWWKRTVFWLLGDIGAARRRAGTLLTAQRTDAV